MIIEKYNFTWISNQQNEYTDWERPPRNPLGSRDAALELLSDGHTVAPIVRGKSQIKKILKTYYI